MRSGQDRATVALWESNVGVFGTDIYKGIISTNDNFDENVTLAGSTGTPSITSYLWLTVASANRHSGVAGTGHGRMRATGTTHILTMNAAFTRVDWLELKVDQAGSSDEGIRIDQDECLVEYCIIWTDSSGADQDGIYINEANNETRYISNCIIYGFERGQIHHQSSSNNTTHTTHVDHCTLIHTETAAEPERGAMGNTQSKGSATTTFNMFNTIGYMEAGTDEPFWDGDGDRATPTGTMVWNGSHNLRGDQGTGDQIDGTDNTTSWQSATDGDSESSQSSGSFVVFNDITPGTEDFTLLDDAAGNLAAGNGTNRQGSEPDARQDFSVDITGSARPTTGVDIGAHQVSSGSGPQTITGTLLARSPTFPTGAVNPGNVDLDGLLLARSPTFPTGAVNATNTLTGILLARSPTFPTGVVTPGNVDLDGVLLARSPTFPIGVVSLAGGPQTITGVLLARAPTFPTGAVNATNTLLGVLLARSPTFPTGAVTPGNVNLGGVLFTKSGTFPTGTVTPGNVNLGGVLLVRSPTFPTGAVNATNTLLGLLLARSPTFPTGTVTPGPVTISGLLLARSPTFPIGAVTLIVVGQVHPDAPLFAVLVSSPALAELTERGFSVAELEETGSIADLDETKSSA